MTGHERGIHPWQQGVQGAVFSPDGKQVVTCGQEGTARLWDAVTGQELATWKGHGEVVAAAAFSPDGRLVLTQKQDNFCRLWPTDPLSAALQQKPRELTQAEKRRFDLDVKPGE